MLNMDMGFRSSVYDTVQSYLESTRVGDEEVRGVTVSARAPFRDRDCFGRVLISPGEACLRLRYHCWGLLAFRR